MMKALQNEPAHEVSGTNCIIEHWSLKQAYAIAQTQQSLCCWHTQSMDVDEDSDQY